jgi:ABC-type uncharacterized transport system permease subunit
VANFILCWMVVVNMQHCVLIVSNSYCLYCFMFLMCAFMEELNCGHLVWYVYNEFTGLLICLSVFHGAVFGIGS